jgi:hypothetical protein
VRVVMMSEVPGAERTQSSSATVQTAIQEPGRAYVLGWSATRNGDTWLFDGAPATTETKPRAVDFDGGVAMTGDATGAPGAGASASGLSPEMAAFAYFAVEFQRKVSAAAGVPFVAPRQLDGLNTLSDEGKRAVESGTLPGAIQFAGAIDGAKMMAPALSEDQLLGFAAEILKITPEQARELYNRGRTQPGGITPVPRGGRGVPVGG